MVIKVVTFYLHILLIVSNTRQRRNITTPESANQLILILYAQSEFHIFNRFCTFRSVIITILKILTMKVSL